MYILVLFAVLHVQDVKNPLVPVTRSQVQYFLSEEGCKLNVKSEAKMFKDALSEQGEVLLMGASCTKVTGPAGTTA
jgi:hypothetical protein